MTARRSVQPFGLKVACLVLANDSGLFWRGGGPLITAVVFARARPPLAGKLLYRIAFGSRRILPAAAGKHPLLRARIRFPQADNEVHQARRRTAAKRRVCQQDQRQVNCQPSANHFLQPTWRTEWRSVYSQCHYSRAVDKINRICRSVRLRDHLAEKSATLTRYEAVPQKVSRGRSKQGRLTFDGGDLPGPRCRTLDPQC